MFLFVLSAELLDALFLGELADEQGIVVLGDDISIESLDDNFLFLRGVYDTVVGFKERDVLSNAGVAVEVFLRLLLQRTPRAQVAPSEVGRTYEDLLSFLHDGIVYADVLTLWEQLVYLLLLLRSAVDGQ